MTDLSNWMMRAETAAHRAAFVWRARRAVVRLRHSSDEAAAPLADALAATLQPALDAAEARWIPRIEALRAALRASDEVITFEDFGAGNRLGSGSTSRTVTHSIRSISRSAVPPHEGRALFQLVRHVRPQRCLELGTSLGLSAAFLAAALVANGHGRLVTLEGGAALARRASAHLARLGLDQVEVVPGRFQDTLPGLLEDVYPVDFVFLDGHHDPEAAQRYVDLLMPYLQPGALLVFDDLAWNAGMRRAWRSLAADRRFVVCVDLFVIGMAVVRNETGTLF